MVAFSVWMGRHEAVIRDQRAIDGPPLVLNSGGTVEQSLEMDVDGFSAVEVWISDAPSDTSEGTLALTGWSGTVQFEPVKVSGTQLESSKMNRLSFDRTYPAGVYTILLQWDGAQPVILGRSQSDVLPQGELVVNGQSTSQDLAFRTIAHLDWSRILTEALGRFADDSVFAVFWLLSLLSTLVLSAGPCVLVFLRSRLTRGRTE